MKKGQNWTKPTKQNQPPPGPIFVGGGDRPPPTPTLGGGKFRPYKPKRVIPIFKTISLLFCLCEIVTYYLSSFMFRLLS